MKVFQKLLWTSLFIGLCALGGSFAGGLHPLGDALAVFRVQSAVIVIIQSILLTLCGYRIALTIAVGATLSIAPIFVDRMLPRATPVQGMTHYQKNLLFRLPDPALIIADIRIADPDIVTLQEVSARNLAVLDGLKETLPSQVFCRYASVGGVAIATKWPIVPGTDHCPSAPGLAVMQVDSPQGRIWLASLHLHWPYPYEQAAQLQKILAYLHGLDGPIVLGGDFNMVPWSHALHTVKEMTGNRRVGTARSSFPRFHPWVRLPIDHVFAPSGGTTELRPLLGSDHYGVLARINVNAQ